MRALRWGLGDGVFLDVGVLELNLTGGIFKDVEVLKWYLEM